MGFIHGVAADGYYMYQDSDGNKFERHWKDGEDPRDLYGDDDDDEGGFGGFFNKRKEKKFFDRKEREDYENKYGDHNDDFDITPREPPKWGWFDHLKKKWKDRDESDMEKYFKKKRD